MDLIDWLPYLPGGYTYSTRCRGFKPAAIYLLREWMPFLLVLPIVFHIPVLTTFAALIGWQGLYECGYLFNDLSCTAGEPGGARLTVAIDWRSFVLVRIVFLAPASSLLRASLGDARSAVFVLANVVLLGLLIAHTLVGTLADGLSRIMTFAALSVYRYAPLLAPIAGLGGSGVLLLIVFLAYGQARVVRYVFRKHPITAAAAPFDQDAMQAALLAAFSPLVLTLVLWIAQQPDAAQLADAMAAFWTIHILIGFSIIGVRLYRRAPIFRWS